MEVVEFFEGERRINEIAVQQSKMRKSKRELDQSGSHNFKTSHLYFIDADRLFQQDEPICKEAIH